MDEKLRSERIVTIMAFITFYLKVWSQMDLSSNPSFGIRTWSRLFTSPQPTFLLGKYML